MSVNDYQQLVQKYSQQYKVPTALVNSVMRAESGGNASAHSGAGAIGLMQLMPGTAHGLGVDPYNAQQNIQGGAKLLGELLHQYHGNLTKTVAAYNAGAGAVNKYHGVPPYAETQNYVNKVLGYFNGSNPQGKTTPASTPTSAGNPLMSAPQGAGTLSAGKQFLFHSLFSDNPSLEQAITAHAQDAAAPAPTQTVAKLPNSIAQAATSGGVGGQLVATAASQVGQNAADAMRYIRAAGGKGTEAWCGDFVQWVFKARGLTPPPARSVPGLLTWAKQNHRLTTNPGSVKPGTYLAMMDWNHDGTPDHVEMVTGVTNHGINTIGGNTSLPGGGMGVARKQRGLADILGFVNAA